MYFGHQSFEGDKLQNSMMKKIYKIKMKKKINFLLVRKMIIG